MHFFPSYSYTEADTKDFIVYLNTSNVMGLDTFSIQSTVSYSVVHENFSYIGTGYVSISKNTFSNKTALMWMI
jgi:hypothetical protein